MSYPQKRNMKGVSVNAAGEFKTKRGSSIGTDNHRNARKYRRVLAWLSRYRKSNGRSVPVSRFRPPSRGKNRARLDI